MSSRSLVQSHVLTFYRLCSVMTGYARPQNRHVESPHILTNTDGTPA